MNKTFIAKKEQLQKKWYLVDAKDKILGRFACKVAAVLKGKHKAIYTPYVDTGDGVIIINASAIKFTGRKLKQKVYHRYSGYPGGLREVTLKNMLSKKPVNVVRLAVKRMLPGGPLGRKMLKKLKIFADDKYPQVSQKLISLEV